MKTLFLDQSGKLGGAQLCLLDMIKPYRGKCLVCLFSEGPFQELLAQEQIPVQVLITELIEVRKESGLSQGLRSLTQLVPLILQVACISRNYDLIYANTQKALVVGAIASFISRRPLVYHLHDIISLDHFSSTNSRLIVALANQFASLIIANSEASQKAFVAAGGKAKLTEIVYNGFRPESYSNYQADALHLRQVLNLDHQFVVGHFSRLSPWKGQHVLIQALTHCPEDVTALLVGDALFGEEAYVEQLHHQIAKLGLEHRVQFLGFRSDIPQLMTACDLITHTSTAPEPFGRVIVEAMLCRRPVVAAKAGGAMELVSHGETGWLCLPDDPKQLAEIILTCRNQPEQAAAIAQQGQEFAKHQFHVDNINQKIAQLLDRVLQNSQETGALAHDRL